MFDFNKDILTDRKKAGGEIRGMKEERKNRGNNHETWGLCTFSHVQGIGGASW